MKFFPIFLFVLFFPALVCAADIEIIEVQTNGGGGASDEYVKLINNSGSQFSLSDLILQSHSSSIESTTWTTRSGGPLPEIIINSGETAVLSSVSSTYSGVDEVWRYTKSWGLADSGGGARLINSDGSVIAEKYWGSLENLNQPQPAPELPAEPEPIIETPAPEETPQVPEPEPEPIPETPPQQSDNLTIEQSTDEQSDNLTIEQFNNEEPILSPAPANAEEILIPIKEINIQISEFIPNPAGSDDGEWIEIKNVLNESSDISGWFLDDEDNGSKPYKIPENTIIPANGFLVFYKIQTKLALNNDTDSVRILKPTGEIAEKVDYSGCAEGQSFARGTDKWSWTTTPTPSLQNIITAPAPKKSSATSNPPATVYGEITKTNEKSFYILEEDGDEIKINLPAENLSVGDKVEITGTVKKTASGNQMTPKKQADIIIKDKAPAKEENTATNPNLKYYIVLGIGLCSVAGMEGWKRRKSIKTKYKQIFSKSEALTHPLLVEKSETNINDQNFPPKPDL